MVTKNNAINAATESQTFGNACSFTNASVSMSALATATTSDIVYYGVGGILTKGAAPSGGGGAVSTLQTWITSSGTFTPNAKCLWAVIQTFGAGGGGGGVPSATNQYAAAGGGGAGGYSEVAVLVASLLPNISITIGAAGAGGTAGSAGVNGGTTTTPFNSATGGTGGLGGITLTIPNCYFAGGSGGGSGSSSSGLYQVNQQGNAGRYGIVFATAALTAYCEGGTGGNGPGTFFGGRSVIAPNSAQSGFAPTNPYNGGGSGAVSASVATNSVAGGAGGAGLVIITQYLSP